VSKGRGVGGQGAKKERGEVGRGDKKIGLAGGTRRGEGGIGEEWSRDSV